VVDYAAIKHLLVDSTGRKLTSGLFFELADPASGIPPQFKLSEWRTEYVRIADPTDYKAAMALIGSWEHWEALVANPRFREHLEQWRKEVDVKLRSEAIAALRAQSKSATGVAAARWLAEQGGVPKNKGRQPKSDKPDSGESFAKDDAKRLSIVK
jgi:hypothetical protein